jgi:hypothetical protein
MSLNKPNQKKEKLAIYSKTLIDWKSPENACIKFISDLNNYGVKTENIEMGQIIEVIHFLSKAGLRIIRVLFAQLSSQSRTHQKQFPVHETFS